MAKYFFTSESVTKGHPDKVCDQISDAILDAYLKGDKYSRVACEVAITTGKVFVIGEITSKATVDIKEVVRKTLCDIGYKDDEFMFNPYKCEINVFLDKQSEDIAGGVDNAYETRDKEDRELGAGDQGIIFGYACDETDNLMPTAIEYSHRLTRKLEEVREKGIIDYLGPDGKSQVTVEYDDDKVVRFDTIIISTQHLDGVSSEQIEEDVIEKVIKEVVPSEYIDVNTKIYVNPSGRFVVGGPVGDAGVTGRKIIVDTYGGYAPHGGGAFSGKDPTKVDRSAAYMARFVCKNIIAKGLAKKCQLQIAYAIGIANPVAININTYGTSEMSNEELEKYVMDNYDLRPSKIIERLKLRSPMYQVTASGGHFGRDSFTWEEIHN
ncbi:MAG: methionine adenosyltransferase [Clostridia bacterium]|jgi:S-adenosylmethionine synthetase|nr:methionine adenosyltransferase [Clostridia bacterium]